MDKHTEAIMGIILTIITTIGLSWALYSYIAPHALPVLGAK